MKRDTLGPSARRLRRQGQILMLVAWCLCVSPALVTAQPIVRSFDGDKGPGLAECQAGGTWCGRQPEVNVAANGKQVVQVTWQNVRTYDYTGKLLQSTPLAAFIRKAGLEPFGPRGPKGPNKGPYEPHVVFDEFIGRWLVTSTCSNDCLLVSATADPQGPWGGVYLSCLDGGPCLATNPGIHIGYDKNGVYYCGAHIGEDSPEPTRGPAYDCFAVIEDGSSAFAVTPCARRSPGNGSVSPATVRCCCRCGIPGRTAPPTCCSSPLTFSSALRRSRPVLA